MNAAPATGLNWTLISAMRRSRAYSEGEGEGEDEREDEGKDEGEGEGEGKSLV